MRRFVALLLVAHGMAHAAIGLWAYAQGPAWVVTILWWLATLGFVGAGFGLLGAVGLRRCWEQLAATGAIASGVLLLLYGRSVYMLGMLLDVVLAVAALRAGESALTAGWFGQAPARPRSYHRHGRWGIAGSVGAYVFLAYVSGAILLRPWHLRWGASTGDVAAHLPGDELVPGARYRMDHVITIDAPADSVWPWLVQIGQDRGGFYSYWRLEHLVGADIHNADRIVPAWQHRKAGDFIPAVQPDYLGGILGDSVGWRVADVVPGRALVLEDWGAFVVEPVDSATSRLHVRLRGDASPSLATILLAPLNVLVFEPAHFIMERGMLRGIKQRAERGGAAARTGGGDARK